ncbi:MAG: S8 family peptidase, partial [Gemmatimonadaceae bacterium]
MRSYYSLTLVAGLVAVTACHDAAVGPNESAPQSPSGGIEILPGNPGDPARSRLPDQDWPGSVAADLSSDPALGGLTVGRRRLYIVVDEAATVAAVNAALQQEKAKVIGGLRAEAVLVVEIPESGSVTRIRTVQSRWSTLGIFSTVALDSEMDFTWLPSNPNINAWSWTLAPADGNWGLEHARFAQAWNVIRPFSGRVNLTTLPDAVVMDDGFDPAHEDLTALRISNAVQTNTVQDHGTHVAGTISADWDNGRGIEGATPVGGVIGTALKLPLTNKTTFDTFIRTFDRILRRQLLPGQPTAVRVVNMSVGYNWRRNAQINADTSPASQALVRAHGEIAARQTHRAKSAGIAIVVAAGNDYASHSQWSNPFNWARSNGGAVRDQSVCGGVCASDNVITVEAHRAGGNLAGFSNRGGSLSAPGEGIVSLTQSPSPYPYDSWNGTSMAAPHVSGLLLMLAAFDPNLTPAELVSLVTRNDGTHPNGTGSRGVDAFSSMINYDLLRGGVRAQRSLVDTDDGTRDGNDRLSSASAFGDGHVTMRDFRRFRDAMLRIDVDNRDLLAGEIELNGPANSPKRDLNGDRRIYPDGGRFETIYSRFDFNGDGFLSQNAKPQDRRGDITDRFRNR